MHLDAPLRFLEFVSRRLEGLPVLVLAATRPGEPGAEEELLSALAYVKDFKRWGRHQASIFYQDMDSWVNTQPWRFYETDANGNFVPDCNLLSNLANGECGQSSTATLGQLNIIFREIDSGFGVRNQVDQLVFNRPNPPGDGAFHLSQGGAGLDVRLRLNEVSNGLSLYQVHLAIGHCP